MLEKLWTRKENVAAAKEDKSAGDNNQTNEHLKPVRESAPKRNHKIKSTFQFPLTTVSLEKHTRTNNGPHKFRKRKAFAQVGRMKKKGCVIRKDFVSFLFFPFELFRWLGGVVSMKNQKNNNCKF